MTANPLIFCLLLLTQLSVQNAFGGDSYTPSVIPTFKEITPTSAEAAFLSDEFSDNLYPESQNFSENAYWHKLTFPKATEQESTKTLYLTFSYYIIEQLDFYLFHDGQLVSQWKRGALQDWGKDSRQYDGIWIPITLSNQHSTSLLIRKQGNHPLLTPIKLMDSSTATNQKAQKLIFWTFIISTLCILLIYNVFLFILLKQPGFIYYLALNLIIFISLSTITGFNRWIFSQAISQWITSNLFVVFGLGAWILFRFSIHFLKETQIPAPNTLIKQYGDWLFVAFLLATQLFSVKIFALLFAFIEVFLFFICITWGIKAYYKGFTPVRFYLFSWFFLLTGSILNTLIFWKILPITPATEAIFPIACIVQLLGFAFAFADKAKQMERDRRIQALTDLATHLPNRTYYFDKLPAQLEKQGLTNQKLALVIIDLTNHQTLSQAFGPAKADAAMCEIILKVHQQTMTMDGLLPFSLSKKNAMKIIRMTTKNIVFISTQPEALKTQIQQIQDTLDHPTLVNKIHFRHQYKIGSALYPSQGTDLDKLYQNALIAKDSVTYSSGNWVPFTDNLKNNHAHQLRLITLLTEDIQHDILYFDIQPQVDLSTNEIVGGEVLIRWHNDHIGQVSPGEFIPLAEQTGLIYKLTDKLLESVFLWASQHPKALSTQRLSINISALDLLQENFAQRILEHLSKYQLVANKFTIEITETSVFQNNALVHNNVKQLHQAGFKLAIDDFGVGYSSMQNLVALETDELKIDRFFITNLLDDTQSQILSRNMIDLSKNLDIISVAEGIESDGILQLLKSWHCQVGQGYHLYRPMSPTDYLTLLDKTVPPLSTPTNRA
ncbi:EAL domain-containing protein [Marinomonas sp. RS-M-Aa-14]|uniref:EAL domain-containing protein n=1 Tax=Marinomonas sp. RS-M-Aa-14 TaxID=3241169 RepID=UPI00390CCBF4